MTKNSNGKLICLTLSVDSLEQKLHISKPHLVQSSSTTLPSRQNMPNTLYVNIERDGDRGVTTLSRRDIAFIAYVCNSTLKFVTMFVFINFVTFFVSN